jgi:plasmid stabilization system protein ParE
MKIVWSKQASYTFYITRNYLIQYWNDEIAQRFVDEVIRIITLISSNPYLGKSRSDLQCNEILISKHITLYYVIKKGFIHLIKFYNNRQKPITVLNF